MTFEELKAEAEKKGYRLYKKPRWDCSCTVQYPNKYHQTNRKGWKCIEKFEFLETSKQGLTHCVRKEVEL